MSGEPQMVRVDWTDSVTDGGWSDREEAIRRAAAPDVMACTSVGFVIDDTPEYLLVGTSWMRDGDLVQGALQIPRVAVREVRRLRRA